MTVSPDSLLGKADFANAKSAAHELYHAIQSALPEAKKRVNSRRDGCQRPKWIEEGHADTIAINYMRGRYPRAFPPRSENKVNLAGLRPYHWPLHVRFPDDPPLFVGGAPRKNPAAYQTSSFWLHIGDRYRKGDFHFIQDYQINPAPTYAGDKEDWLNWLDTNLRNDLKVSTPLYRVYPGFLTHFLGAWKNVGWDIILLNLFGPDRLLAAVLNWRFLRRCRMPTLRPNFGR